MKKLTILIDMDDTIENLCETWVKFLNKRYGTKVSLNDIKEWDMTKAFPTLRREEIYQPLSTDILWKEVKPISGAVEYIQTIIEDGHKVFIVTASHHETIMIKLNNVLFKYFPYLSYKDVIITSHKQLIKGDVLIDDAPHNLEGGDYIKILYNAPHNMSYCAENHNMIRVNDWKEIYKIINMLSKGECYG